MVDVYVLPAKEGDCICIRYGDSLKTEKKHNILVDGGVKETGKIVSSIVKDIASKNEKLDIILTHIDGDHIQGLIFGFYNIEAKILQQCIQKIYFNTCKNISEYYAIGRKENREPVELVKVNVKYEKGYSVSEAKSLLDILAEKDLLDRIAGPIIAGQTLKIENAELNIISPTQTELIKLINNWDENSIDHRIRRAYGVQQSEFVNQDLSELCKRKLPNADNSIYNKSSIAFSFRYKDIRLMLLGDASASVCNKGLKIFEKQDISTTYDAIKMAHHGSSRNISDRMLQLVNTDTYIVSTNGYTLRKQKSLPGKVGLAHIINANNKPVHLLCNYSWWQNAYHGAYFTNNDIRCVINRKLFLHKLDKDGYQVKEGLKIYGEWK